MSWLLSLDASRPALGSAKPALNARLRQARCAGGFRTPAQVEPPGEREACRVEDEVNHERKLRPAGHRDRLAEAARDQIAAASADRTDEAERCAALDRSNLQRGGASGVAFAPRLVQVLLTEDRRDHPVGRSVANAGRDKKNEEHRQEAEEVLGPDEIEDADGGGRHGDEVPEGDDGTPDLVGQKAAEGAR